MKLIALFFCFSLLAAASRAQTSSAEEQVFLDALNRLVAATVQSHWHYDQPMQADSSFHLNGDTLSITWVCTVNNSRIRTRFAAPFSKIKSVDWDYYLVLNYGEEKLVSIYEKTDPDSGWELLERSNLLHIAAVDTENKKEMKMKKKIEKAFESLKL